MNSGPIVRGSALVTVSLKLDKARHLSEISSLVGISVDDIVSEALDDWINCVAPVRLEALLDSQNEKRRLDIGEPKSNHPHHHPSGLPSLKKIPAPRNPTPDTP